MLTTLAANIPRKSTMTTEIGWRNAVLAHAQAINAYVAEGDRRQWKKMPKDPVAPDLSALHERWKEAIIAANVDGLDVEQSQAAQNAVDKQAKLSQLRTQWPVTYEPIIPLLGQKNKGIGALAWIDDEQFLVRVGSTYEKDHACYRIADQAIQKLAGLSFFASCKRLRYWAKVYGARIDLHDGFDGPKLRSFLLPTPAQAAFDDVKIANGHEPVQIQELHVYSDGCSLLLASSAGIWVLREQSAELLLPTRETLRENWNDEFAEDADEDSFADDADEDSGVSLRTDMSHAALSADDRLIICGHQDGKHQVFDAVTLKQIGEVGPHGEYPHHAGFSADGKVAYFNACHFYNGGTIAVPVEKLSGFDSDFYQDHNDIKLIQGGARVYASAVRGDEIVLGDANGYLHAVSPQGTLHWKHFLGGTIGAIAISPNGKRLIVGSYADWVAILALDVGAQPENIGTSRHQDQRRWLFWPCFDRPMMW
jgi:hypothetical protein